jgi:23S rRNA pseudouridine1911/1915/1917 synthase
VERFAHATLVEAVIHTGRTHQIRVHFHFLGHPLVGDVTYGARLNKKFTGLTGLAGSRVLLHSRKLTFVHPRTGQEMSFTAPLPEDFQQALIFLRKQG